MRTALKSINNKINFPFGIPGAPKIKKFIRGKTELSKIKKVYKTDTSRYKIVILYGLRGIGKM